MVDCLKVQLWQKTASDQHLDFRHAAEAAAAAGDPVAKFCMQHAVDYSVQGPVQSGSAGSSKQTYLRVGQAENALRALPVERGTKKIGL